MKRLFAREPGVTIIYGILCMVMLLVVLQLWLQVAAINAYLGGDPAVAWPEMIASAACFLLNLGLQHYLQAMERKWRWIIHRPIRLPQSYQAITSNSSIQAIKGD